MNLRSSFVARRRRKLTVRAQFDPLESRSTITEPIPMIGLAAGSLGGLARLGLVQVHGGRIEGGPAPAPTVPEGDTARTSAHVPPPSLPDDVLPFSASPAVGGGGGTDPVPAVASLVRAKEGGPSVLDLADATGAPAGGSHGLTTPWKPASRPGGGAALAPRGGSGSGAQPAAIAAVQGRSRMPARPTSSASRANGGGGAAGSAALLAAVAGASRTPAMPQAPIVLTGTAAPAADSTTASPTTAPTSSSSSASNLVAGGGAGGSSSVSGGTVANFVPNLSTGNVSGPSQEDFPYFPLYVRDNNDGVVLFPGVDQLATLNASVKLQAQVTGTTVSSYHWDTSGISSSASGISGTSSQTLSFRWTNSNLGSAYVAPITLAVTDTNSHTETYTYDFEIPFGQVPASGGPGDVTWPSTLAPDLIGAGDPVWTSDGVAVDSNIGALDATIPLPSYNPNVPALALTYDSQAADPTPLILAEHTLSASSAVPTSVAATLTFNGTAGTTWYYDTSGFVPGDVQQVALQADAGALSTGRYDYSVQLVDEYSTPTTTTYSGTMTVLNQSSGGFGAGWTLGGLEKITTASGGVILDLGGGGSSLWFSGSFGSGGGTYTSPDNDFSTLVKNSNGTYTRTLADGTQIAFDSGGKETATIDRNGLHTTFAYNGSGKLSSVEDPYDGYTTFTYGSGGSPLQSIEDPAGRFTTLTYSGGDLTAVEQADGARVTYTYGSSGRMTEVEDARSNVTTIAYDGADRVGTITTPDLSTAEFSAFEEQGWTDSGTSTSPAAATLMAAATASYTSPNGNTGTLRPDWFGLGQPGVAVDAPGNVSTYDVGSNGLATVAVDPLNNISQFSYDSKGNMTEEVYPDGHTDQYTYNGFAEPLTHTNANSDVTTYTYDSHGNNTVVEDPLTNRTTMTYTADGMIQTLTNANDHTTSFAYDSQDRLTTVTFPDGTTNLASYNAQGDVIQATDGRGNSTTISYDALNRATGTTDALGDVTTITYDANGNVTEIQAPTPAGETARTTTYAYDSMDRLTTITDPLGNQTVLGYDADGNRTTVTDPLGRVTTTQYDELDRPTVVIDPMGGVTTTTYDADGNVLEVEDPLGRDTSALYNSRGWVGPITDPLGKTTTYTYTPMGLRSGLSMQAASGGAVAYSYEYDADNRVITVSDPAHNVTTYAYDAVGNTIGVTDPNGHTTSYAYDSMERLATVTDATGNTTVYGYDDSGNQATVTDGLGHTSTVQYDALDRATTLTSAIDGVTTITYDAAGRETSLTDPVGNTTSWAYDANDRVTTVTEPNGHTVTYVYDDDGEVTDTTDADGRRTTYSYDQDGDVTGETWLDSSGGALNIITFTYDAARELTDATDNSATLTFTYDSGGNQASASTSGPGTGQPSVTLSSTYDAQHDRLTLSDNLTSAGLTTYSYDADERVTEVASSYGGTSGPQVDISYDSGGRITAENRTIGGSGVTVNTTFSYDAANRQTTIADWAFIPAGSGGSTTNLATFVYGYDQAGRVTGETDAEGTASFTYDHANELTGVTGSRSESYSYDLNGNRNSTGYSTGTENEQTAAPGSTYTYDNAGNMISQTDTSTHVTTTYTYDDRNRLTEVTTGGTVVATYTYDALNNRIGTDDNGTQTWTIYDGTNPYADFNGSGSLEVRYQYGPGVVNGAAVDELLARTGASGSTAWYLTDKLGSVRDIVDSSANELDHVVYDSFGNIVTETNAAKCGDRFKFAGMEFDAIIGQYYDRARFYNSSSGRFISQDPIGFRGGDPDTYRYVGNSPIDATDPLGELTEAQGQRQTLLEEQEQRIYNMKRAEIQRKTQNATRKESANAAYQQQQIVIWGNIQDQANQIYQRRQAEATAAEHRHILMQQMVENQGGALKAELAAILQRSLTTQEMIAAMEARLSLEIKLGEDKEAAVMDRDKAYTKMVIARLKLKVAEAELDEATKFRQMWLNLQQQQHPPTQPSQP